MKKTSNPNDFINQCRFDSFCRTVLRNKARDIYRANKRYVEKFVSINSLSQEELEHISISDIYDTDYIHFEVMEYDIPVEDILLAEAIETLPKQKKDIILLSYFTDMTDLDIANEMGVRASTIFYHKKEALKKIKKYMEEHTKNEQ